MKYKYIYEDKTYKLSEIKNVKKYPKRSLDKMESSDLYRLFMQLLITNDYNNILCAFKILHYMESNRQYSDYILPMYRYMKTKDYSYIHNNYKQYVKEKYENMYNIK